MIADVESVHHTIEEEPFNVTSFSSRDDFMKKAEGYRYFYNLERPNFSKQAKTPWLIAHEDHKETNFATRVIYRKFGADRFAIT